MSSIHLVDPRQRLRAIGRQKQIRQEAGLNAEEYGKALKVSASTIHRWENPSDEAAPSVRHIWAICTRFDVSANWLLFGVGPQRLSEARQQSDLETVTARLEAISRRLDPPDT